MFSLQIKIRLQLESRGSNRTFVGNRVLVLTDQGLKLSFATYLLCTLLYSVSNFLIGIMETIDLISWDLR